MIENRERKLPAQSEGRENPSLRRQMGELMWTARAKEAAASIFLQGQYPPPIQALLEFTDNSVGYRNRDKQYPTIILVTVEANRVNVTDFGGLGSDAEGIKRFARVGETEDVGIGYRGAGAKFAAWFFGEDLELRAKKPGENVIYHTEIKGFGSRQIEYRGMFAIDAEKTTLDKDKGRFEIIVRNLLIAKNKLPHGGLMKRTLGEVYRPLLVKTEWNAESPETVEKRAVVDDVGILHQKDDKVMMFLTTRKRKEQVQPLNIPLSPGYSENDIQIIETKRKEKIWYWAGEKDLDHKDAKPVDSGIRFYYDGRLIRIDFCGYDKSDPRLAKLVGEVHLDNIKGIKEQLSVNKSAGINTDSDQWRGAITAVHDAISPLVKKIQEAPIEVVGEMPAFLPTAFAQARRLADLALKEMAADGMYISGDDLLLLVGETKSQRPSIPGTKKPSTGVGGGGVVYPPADYAGRSWEVQSGQTIPDFDADPKIPRVRKSYIDRYEMAFYPDPKPISFIELREVPGEGRKKILILNNSNPIVATAQKVGELVTTTLIGEQLANHMAKEYSTTLDEYLKFRDELLLRLGRLIQNTPAYRVLEARAAESSKRK